MKKITALLLSVLLLVLSVPCMAEDTPETEYLPAAEIHLDFFRITASFSAEKNYGELTARIVKKQSAEETEPDRNIYAMDQRTGEKTETGYTYTFRFKLPENAASGAYILTVGGAYGFTQEFTYYNVMEKVYFYNALDVAPVFATAEEQTIYELLTGEDCKASYDLTLYKSLAESVRLLVDAEIEKLNLASNQETVTAAEQLFTETLNKLLPLAVLLNVDTTTSEKTLDDLVKMGKDAGVLDDTGYAALPHTYVLKYLVQEIPDALEQTAIANAFSRAILLATVEVMDASSASEIFDYYLEKEIVSVNETNYDSVNKESLFAAVKELGNPDIATLEQNVDAQALNMLGTPNTTPIIPGGGGGGSTGGGGGGSFGGGGGYNAPNGSAGFSGDAQDATVEDSKTETDKPVEFADLDSVPWAVPAVEALSAEGILSGREEGVFAPNDRMSREELVKLIVLSFGGLEENAKADFSDVAKDRWSYPYIASAYQLELVTGVGGTEFAPESPVTRQDMATILHRVLKKTGDAKNGALDFTDADSISPYAKEAVGALVSIGAINGMGDGTFAPKSPVTRAQAAKVVYEMMQYIGGDKS